MVRNKKGQSTLEYIILVAGIIAVLMLFLRPGGTLRAAYNEALVQGTNGMINMAERLRESRPLSQ